MASLKSLIDKLNLLRTEKSSETSKRKNRIKLLICEIFEYLIMKKQDTVLDNIVLWFKHCQENVNQFNKQIIEKEIKEDLKSVLPDVFQTGFLSQGDDHQKDFLEKNLNLNLNIFPIIRNKFKKKSEFPNLNELYSTKKEKQVIVPSLFNLFLTSNDKSVERKSLQLLTKLFSQYEDLQRQIDTLEIIFDNEESKIYLFLQDLINSAKYIIEKCEIWLANYVHENEDKNIIDIMISIMKNLNNYFFQGCRLEQKEDKEVSLESPPVGEGKRICKERQNIFRYLKGHLILLDFLKDGAHYLEELIMEMDAHKIYEKKILIDLFTEVFTCLRNFCSGNPENQEVMHSFIPTLLEYVHYDFGQIQLLSTIYENNHKLLEKVEEKLIDKILSLIENEGRQAKFLDILIDIQKCNQEFLVENQILIIKKLLPDKIDSKMKTIFFADMNFKNQINFYFDKNLVIEKLSFLEKLKENNFENTFRDESFHYHKKLFQVLKLLCQGSDVANIATTKLKKIFKLPYLIDLLMEPDLYGNFIDEINEKSINLSENRSRVNSYNSYDKLPHAEEGINSEGITLLKPHLIELIIEVFLKNPIKMSYYDLNSRKIENYISKEVKRLEIANLKLADPEGFKHYMNYFFQYFLELVVYYYNALENKEFFQNDENEDQENVFRYLAITIINQKENFKNKLADKHTENLKQLFEIARVQEPNVDNYYKSWIFHIKSSEAIFGEVLKVTDEYDDVVKEIELEKEENAKENPDSTVRMATSYKRKKVLMPSNKDKSFENWKIFRNEFMNSDLLLKEIYNERKTLGGTLVRIENYKQIKSWNFLFSKNDLIKKLIIFIQEEYSVPEYQGTIIILLDVLKGILDESGNDLEETQNLFNDLEGTKTMLTILSDDLKSLSQKLISKILSFMIALLKKGNKNVQNTFYEFCINYHRSELIFQKFYRIFRGQIDLIEKISKNYNNYTSHEATVDEENEQVFQLRKQILVKTLEKEDKVVVKVLKLLQLLTEGHNLPMQTYLSKQENNRNSYDLVNALVDLLTTYYYHIFCQGMYKQINNCLNTLIEFVQVKINLNKKSLKFKKRDLVQKIR